MQLSNDSESAKDISFLQTALPIANFAHYVFFGVFRQVKEDILL